MDFDREYLDLPTFAERRAFRDGYLREHGVDPEEFHVWARESEISNECDSDEYRESQPAKGLAMIADFLHDFRAGKAASEEVIRLTNKWVGVVDDAHSHPAEYEGKTGVGWYLYGGAEELKPILAICFDFMWEEGGSSLYTPLTTVPDDDQIAWFKEDHS